jgi:HSP20 family protein
MNQLHKIRTRPTNWLNSVLGDGMWTDLLPSTSSFSSSIPAKVYEEGGKIHAIFRVPGVKQEDIDLNLEHNILTITIKAEHQEKTEGTVYRDEFYSFEATRSIELPKEVDADSATVSMKSGEIHFEANIAEKARGRKLQIESKE